MADEPKVEISLKEIYDEFRELSSNIKTILDKVDGHKIVTDDHEKRLRFAEKCLYMFPPTIIGVIVNTYMNFKK